MSQQAVSFVIHALVADRDLRDRFVMSPMKVLVDLHLSADIELTLDEVEALVQASPDVWRPIRGLTRARIH
jgi:hypothetical protein